MNGHQLVERVLGQTNYDVGPLIDLANGRETDWLEFKAASRPTDGNYARRKNRQENDWDFRWDISKALIGLANHVGGAVLLGVGERGEPDGVEPVDLAYSGFDGDRDRFMRDVIRTHLLAPDHGWNTGTQDQWFCDGLRAVVTPRWGRLFGHPIVVLLVRAQEQKPNTWLRARRRAGEFEEDVLLYRAAGDFGRTNTISQESAEDWWRNRQPADRADLDQLFADFIEGWTAARKKPDAETDAVIAALIESSSTADSAGTAGSLTPGRGGFFDPVAEPFGDLGAKKRTAPSRRKVQAVLETQAQSVLLGDPGSGKSTCFREAASRLAQHWAPGKPWALVVDLASYRELGLRATILSALGDQLSWVDIEHRVVKGELVLLLDGLNECPVARYEECCQEILSLHNIYRTAKIHISSRISHNPTQFKFPAFRILPMTPQEQLDFLVACTGNRQRAESILNELSEQPGAEHLAGSPILLSIVADIGTREGESLPSGLAKLYLMFLEHWFAREREKDAATGAPALWSFGEFLEALASLAFQMRSEGRVSCASHFARNCVTPIIGPDHVARFLTQMSQGLLLGKDRTNEEIHFAHETIQEFFAAEFLSTRPKVLDDTLSPEASDAPSNWLMPLVFAFELIETPHPEFLDAAWKREPMLTAVAMRNDVQLQRLKLKQTMDPWLRGCLRVLRDEDRTAEERELAFASRVPPKYPLPPALTTTLASSAFWYAGSSHVAGAARLERLRQLLLDRNSMWIEVLAQREGDLSRWAAFMSPAQLCLAGIKPDVFLRDPRLLSEATVVELCALLRYKRISDAQFADHWLQTLDESPPEHLETNLLALLRTAAKITTRGRQISITELGRRHSEALSRLTENWHLSPRLLHILAREGFVKPDMIQADPGRVADLVQRISPMNMYRFLKSGLLRPADFPPGRLKLLGSELKPELAQELVNARLLSVTDIVGARYSADELSSAQGRQRIKAELAAREWEVIVTKLPSDGDYGFVRHPKFNEDVFVFFDRIENPKGRRFSLDNRLRVVIELSLDRKRDRWGYRVKSGRFVADEH